MQPAAVCRFRPRCFDTHRPGRHPGPRRDSRRPGPAPKGKPSGLHFLFSLAEPAKTPHTRTALPFKTFPGRCRRSSPQSPDGFAFSPLAGQAIMFGRAGESRLAIPFASSFHGSPRLATRREQPGAPVTNPSISFGKLTATSSQPCSVACQPDRRRQCRPRRNQLSRHLQAGSDRVAATANIPPAAHTGDE